MKVDLHTHTYFSDGAINPLKTLALAKDLGIEVISFTDHDSVDAYYYLEEKGFQTLGLKLIVGIELSVKDPLTKKEIHMLGYGIDYKNLALNNYLKQVKERENERLEVLIELAEKCQLPDLKAVLRSRQEKKIGNGKLVVFDLYKIKAKDNEKIEKFKKLVKENLKIERIQLSPQDAIKLIHQAGGKAFLAHPNEYKMPFEEIDSLVAQLTKMGLDGVEVFHSSQSAQDSINLLQMVEKYNLIYSGGSDFHNLKKHFPNIRQLGTGTNNNLNIDHTPISDMLISQRKYIQNQVKQNVEEKQI